MVVFIAEYFYWDTVSPWAATSSERSSRSLLGRALVDLLEEEVSKPWKYTVLCVCTASGTLAN